MATEGMPAAATAGVAEGRCLMARGHVLQGALASTCAAWNSPSVAMIFARFSRSASACLARARTIDSASYASLSSTVPTLTPHGSVWRSMMACNFALILSRPPKSSSRLDCPSTAPVVAPRRATRTHSA